MARHDDRDKLTDTLPDNDAQKGQRETTIGHDIDDWVDPDGAANRAKEADRRAEPDDAPGVATSAPGSASTHEGREDWQG